MKRRVKKADGAPCLLAARPFRFSFLSHIAPHDEQRRRRRYRRYAVTRNRPAKSCSARLPALRSAAFVVGGRPVEAGYRYVEKPQIDGELRPMVNQMADDEMPKRRRPRHAQDDVVAPA